MCLTNIKLSHYPLMLKSSQKSKMLKKDISKSRLIKCKRINMCDDILLLSQISLFRSWLQFLIKDPILWDVTKMSGGSCSKEANTQQAWIAGGQRPTRETSPKAYWDEREKVLMSIYLDFFFLSSLKPHALFVHTALYKRKPENDWRAFSGWRK